MSELIAPKTSARSCFRLSQDLRGKGLSVEQVRAATEAGEAPPLRSAMRASRLEVPLTPDFFADNGFSARICCQGRWVPAGEVDLLEGRWSSRRTAPKSRRQRGRGHGPSRHAVSWLAGKLADRGKGLKAGQLVMTGTLTPILPIAKGSTYVASFTTLGEVRKTFI